MKKPTQDRIFFAFAANRQVAKDSPYLYALNKADIPVVLASTHIDEIIFR